MLTPLQWLSAFVCVMVVIGYAQRRRPRIHVPLMISAFCIDLGIVLYLEIARAVVESIPDRPMTAVLLIHIVLSVAVLLLYGVQIVTGTRNARGRRSRLHPQTGLLFVALRFGNLVTSYLVT